MPGQRIIESGKDLSIAAERAAGSGAAIPSRCFPAVPKRTLPPNSSTAVKGDRGDIQVSVLFIIPFCEQIRTVCKINFIIHDYLRWKPTFGQADLLPVTALSGLFGQPQIQMKEICCRLNLFQRQQTAMFHRS